MLFVIYKKIYIIIFKLKIKIYFINLVFNGDWGLAVHVLVCRQGGK